MELEWIDAPQRTEWGDGMKEAVIGLHKNSTARLFCHADDLEKVETAIAWLSDSADRALGRSLDAIDAITTKSINDGTKAAAVEAFRRAFTGSNRTALSEAAFIAGYKAAHGIGAGLTPYDGPTAEDEYDGFC